MIGYRTPLQAILLDALPLGTFTGAQCLCVCVCFGSADTARAGLDRSSTTDAEARACEVGLVF